jgi:hypothetical protein
MGTISDKRAKKAFLNTTYWPRTTTVFSRSNVTWVQCRPKRVDKIGATATHPHLHTAGSFYDWIDPDCFYIRVTGTPPWQCCDVICCEVSNAIQNFQQKRGRYVGAEAAMFVNLPGNWLSMAVETHKRYGDYLFPGEQSWPEGKKVAIRTMRVIYFLDPAQFRKRLHSIDPRPWEYFLPNTSIKSMTSESFRQFVKGISPTLSFTVGHSDPKNRRRHLKMMRYNQLYPDSSRTLSLISPSAIWRCAGAGGLAVTKPICPGRSVCRLITR